MLSYMRNLWLSKIRSLSEFIRLRTSRITRVKLLILNLILVLLLLVVTLISLRSDGTPGVEFAKKACGVENDSDGNLRWELEDMDWQVLAILDWRVMDVKKAAEIRNYLSERLSDASAAAFVSSKWRSLADSQLRFFSYLNIAVGVVPNPNYNPSEEIRFSMYNSYLQYAVECRTLMRSLNK